MSAELERWRFTVYERDGIDMLGRPARLWARGVCYAAGPSCAGGATLQHRRNRGMGGSTVLDVPENLLVLCERHNGLLESDALFAEVGRESGWKLRPGEDPLAVAAWSRPAGAWFSLVADGSRFRVSGRDPESLTEWEAWARTLS